MDLTLIIAVMGFFPLVVVIVIMTVTGWPVTKFDHRFEMYTYLSTLGLLLTVGSGLLMYFFPWESWFHFPDFLLGVVILGVAFPGYWAHRGIGKEASTIAYKDPIFIVQKAASDTLSVAFAAVVTIILVSSYGFFSIDVLVVVGWLILIIMLITCNLLTVYYVRECCSVQ
ncbi:MAG: hypothetical protein KAX20_07555 [Candidatus Omnitrophica bacterium]|nr:hypothetical protein [Candidatus Omnitrophota bacterium]